MEKRVSLGRDVLTLTSSKILTLLVSTITSMLLSRFRTFEEYGTYSQLNLVVTLFASLFMMGLPSSINYFLARSATDEEKREFLSVYYSLSTLLSILMGVSLVGASPAISLYFRNPAIRTFLYFLLLFPWASVVTSSIENVLVVYHKTNLLVGYRFLNSLCLLGCVLVVQWLGLGFREYMVANVAVYVFFAGYVYYTVGRISGGLRFSLNKHWVKTIFAFSIPIGLSSVVGTLNIEIDKLLIGLLMDTEQMAIYTNASKELPVSFIASSVTAVVLPQLTRMLKQERNQEAVKLWGDATELSFICICLISVGVFAYAEDVMTFLYSAKYLPGLAVFRVYTAILLLRCTYFGMILNAKGRTTEILYGSIASLALNVILNPVFYFMFGMTGPAIGTFLSMLVVLLWQLYRTAKCVNVTMAEVFPWKRIGKVLFINMGLAIVFTGLKKLIPLESWITSLGESIALGCVWGMLYLIIMRKDIKRAWNGLNQRGN